MKFIFSLFIALMLLACDAPPPPPVVSAPQVLPKTIDELLANCVSCHGKDGGCCINDAPYIGGQREDYLVNALNEYQQGGRKHEVMSEVVKSISREEIGQLAKYYAEQKAIEWQGAGQGLPPAMKVNKSVIEAGRKRSTSCAACHGPKGISQRSGVPSLAGLPAAYIDKAIHEYNQGIRQNELMLVYKDALTDKAIKELAAYYSALPRNYTKQSSDASRLKRAKKVAQACAGCHGANGSSYLPNVPDLAGQDEAYLLKALGAYKSKERNSRVMQQAIAGLKESVLKELAYFYSRQRPETIKLGEIAFSGEFDPVGDGQVLASSCNGCHGIRSNSPKPAIPHLAGLDAGYLYDAMKAYKTAQRNHPEMKAFVAPLADSDLEKLSLYYALQSPPEIAQQQIPLPPACGACHGDTRPEKTPDLAGQNTAYLIKAINAYRDGTRDNSEMKEAVEALTKEEIITLAKSFSLITPTPIAPRIPESPIALAEKCDRCHGDKSEGGVSPNVPMIQGQTEGYLLKALLEYKSGMRTHSTMNSMAAVLSPLEARAIARYYAEQ